LARDEIIGVVAEERVRELGDGRLKGREDVGSGERGQLREDVGSGERGQ
jgi:hypothetical protein